MSGRRHLRLHFTGAGVAKLAPPLVQLFLLLLVARAGSLDDVGLLALGSAVSFLCGALAELGLATSLSVPKGTFGTESPPLRATRRLRLGAAALGSLVYLLLWWAGLGNHDPVLLLVAPLPFALALAYGYAGAMNASAQLHYEIPVSIGESILIVVLALLGSIALPALTASLAALTIGRGLGAVARMVLVRRMPHSRVARVPGVIRAQLPFALATVGWIVQGQIDMVAVGFVGTLALAAIYGPLVRTAYSTLLSAEALSWALFGGAHPDAGDSSTRLARHWRPMMVASGVVVAAAFVALAEPFLRLLLNRDLPDLGPAIALFGFAIVIRFAALTAHVDIIRAGHQRSEVPVLLASALLLGVAGAIAAGAGSITALAAARLVSELVIATGFLTLRRQISILGAAKLRAPAPDRDDRMRILILSPFPPRLDGEHGGSRVIAQRVTRLADHARIAVLCLRHPSEPETDEGVLSRAELVEEVMRPQIASLSARARRFITWRVGLIRGRPFWVSELRLPAYSARLKQVIGRFRPQVIQIEYAPMAQYCRALKGSPARRVLVDHDPQVADAQPLGAVIGRLDALAWRRFYLRALGNVHAAAVFTERDRAVLEPLAGATPIIRIPIGTDLVEHEFGAGESEGNLLFVGNFVHPPNVDAARRLMTSIFPRVLSRRPDSVLYVVGDSPPQDLLHDSGSQVIVTGRVPDVTPYIERAAVVVAPMRRGGGMRVKVLEALAAGKAVVASPLAAEGLDVEDGEQLLLASTDEEFAARIGHLLDHDDARQAISERALSWARENLTWTASIEAYERLYADLLAGRQPSQALQETPSFGSRSQTRAIHSP